MKKFISILLSVLMLASITAGIDLTAHAAGTFSTNGSCGTNATYVYNSQSNTLTISGTGAIKASAFVNLQKNYYSNITNGYKIVINEGITSVGSKAFCGATATTVTIPKSVTRINSSAFGSNSYLSAVIIYNSSCNIASDFLTGSGNSFARYTVFGYNNSTAQTAAKNAGWNFTAIDNVDCGAGVHAAVFYPDMAVFASNCLEQGYTPGSCVFCNEEVKEYDGEYGNHNYVGATCTLCGAANPNYVESNSASADGVATAENPQSTSIDITSGDSYDDNYTSNVSSSVSNPKSTSIKKLTKGKKKITVQWKKLSGVKGYQVQVATDNKFKKNKKTVNIKKQKTTKTTVKKLKSNKKYYVRVRTYKVVNGKKVYSNWSKVKTVKTK